MSYHGTRDAPRRLLYIWLGDVVDGRQTLNTHIPGSAQPDPTLWPDDHLTLYLGEDRPLVDVFFQAPPLRN